MNPQERTILSSIKKLLLLVLVGSAAIFLVKTIYVGQEQSMASSNHQRKLKIRDFKDIPVTLVEIRNQESETWWKDLEIELKNTSTKPIYFVRAYLLFPDEKLSWGESGIRLGWGDPKKLDSRSYADPEAEHVEPGKTFILTIPEMFLKGLAAKQRLRPAATRNLVLEFTYIYFGDGTGFEGSQLKDFRGNDPPTNKNHHSSRPSASTAQPICGGGNCF